MTSPRTPPSSSRHTAAAKKRTYAVRKIAATLTTGQTSVVHQDVRRAQIERLLLLVVSKDRTTIDCSEEAVQEIAGIEQQVSDSVGEDCADAGELEQCYQYEKSMELWYDQTKKSLQKKQHAPACKAPVSNQRRCRTLRQIREKYGKFIKVTARSPDTYPKHKATLIRVAKALCSTKSASIETCEKLESWLRSLAAAKGVAI